MQFGRKNQNGGTGLFDWRNWVIESVIALFFISGFVVFYNTLTIWLTRKFQDLRRGTFYTRVGLTGFVFIMTAFGLLAENWNPINSEAYMNWALYVLFVPLLDVAVSRLENFIRFGAILIFWTLNNNVAAPIFWLSLIPLEMIMFLSYKWPRLIDDSRFLSVGLTMWLAVTFWFTQTQLRMTNILMGIVMFGLMELFTVLYWSAERQEQHERATLVEQVNRDALTNAGSFFAFKDDSLRMMPRSRRLHEPMTLAMFDIDHVKQVNDRYGHTAGNEVLQTVAREVYKMMKAEWGELAELYRTGGEEFNMIILNVPTAGVAPVGQRMLEMIRNREFTFDGEQLQLTLSMGITELQSGDMSFEDVYNRADEYLYHSKQNGRDCITIEGETLSALKPVTCPG